MKNNSILYLSKTGSLFIKFKDMERGNSVFRLVPVWPIENDLLDVDWFEREIASGKVRQLIDLTGIPEQN